MAASWPSRATGSALPTADVVPALPGVLDEVVYDLPSLYTWLRAGAPDASGVYRDRSRRGHHWQQVAEAQRPAINANWIGRGSSSFSFTDTAGTNTNAPHIDLTAPFPVGSFAVAAVFSLAANTSISDGNNRTLLGSTMVSSTQRYQIGQQNRKLRMLAKGASKNAMIATALATAAPHYAIYNYGTNALSIKANGGGWVDSPELTRSELTADITAMVGLGSSSFNNACPWLGDIVDVLIFNANLREPGYSSAVTAIEAMLASR